MFRFFKSKKVSEPLNYELRKYFEPHILWLLEQFLEPTIDKRRVYLPTDNDFSIGLDASEKRAKHVLEIVCEGMQIDSSKIDMHFFQNDTLLEINTGGSVFFTEMSEDESIGHYLGKKEEGKFEISIDRSVLQEPEVFISTIAHELAHVKLLGELDSDENDEYLTDLATVFFGFGVFNANTAFQFRQSSYSWQYRHMGYLKQEDWSYALALFAFLREEDNPEWSNLLNKTIKKDFERSLKYMLQNEDEIFRFDD